MKKPTTVLLADDHAVVRAGLAALLKGEPDLKVVAEVADGEEAVRAIEATRPDVAVVDIAMPLMTGIEVARKVRDLGLKTAVVLLSMHTERAFVKAGLEAGASGYVLKASGTRELVDAVRVAAAGDMYLSPRVTAAALGKLDRVTSVDGAELELTPRERDVLRLIARGLSSKEAAQELGVGVRTVETHRADMMAKLGIRHMPGLVKYAIKHHLATLEE